MTEEPTMAAAEEAAQRVCQKNFKRLIEKVKKESVSRKHKNSKKTGWG